MNRTYSCQKLFNLSLTLGSLAILSCGGSAQVVSGYENLKDGQELILAQIRCGESYYDTL